MPLVLLLGGARSGKSRLGVQLVTRTGSPVTFVATGVASDAEMAERIDKHRAERPTSWLTLEEPHDLGGAVERASADHVLLIDCLSLWVSNLLESVDVSEIEARAEHAARLAARRARLTVAVSNEIGLGLVPMHPLGRTYRDLLGRVNVIWSEAAEDAYLVVAGRLLSLERTSEPERG